MRPLTRVVLFGVPVLACVLLYPFACRSRSLAVPDAKYRETVTAFHTGLAAMQTSQEVLARKEFERVTQLVPEEPAGWANLGLLLMRQQEMDLAATHLRKAGALAGTNAPIERLLALLESRNGRLPEAVPHWKNAMAADPADLKAPYALALDLERAGGDASLADAQRALESLAGRTDNLAIQLELARIAARRGDAAALQKAVAALRASAASWPAPAQEQLRELEAAAANPSAAATRVAFLKNVLLREAAYRAALAAVQTPRAEIGEPLTRFVRLPNPEAHPAPADTGLTFAVEAAGDGPVGAALALWPNGEAVPQVVSAGATLTVGGIPTGTFPGRSGVHGIAPLDMDYDYRTDLLLAGTEGVRLLHQIGTGGFTDVSARVPPALAATSAFGAWAADVDTDGDLDAVIAAASGPVVVLRNNGDDTFAELRPFGTVADVRGFAWADLDGDGVPDAALLDAKGLVRVFVNQRGGLFREAAGRLDGQAAIAVLSGREMPFDVVGVAADGAVKRLGWSAARAEWRTAEVARFASVPPGLTVGAARLLTADLDNNGAADLLVSAAGATRVLLAGPQDAFLPLPAPLGLAAQAAADFDWDGRLEIVGVAPDGRPSRATVRGTKSYGWQALRPRSATATGDQRINSFGVGGEVELRAGLHLQHRTIEGPYVHFGLGEARQAEIVRIVWPNGILQSEFNTAAGAAIAASQRLKGSCPWLFAWNGREMGFVTDLIWRSPLGLRINAQATADASTTEDWVKIRGDQLAARDGAYDLRITAELWETHFFDLLSLLVVDHPQGTEVFVDERFAIPPPPLAVTVTGPVGDVLAARDDAGADVSETVRARDGRHLDFAGRGAYQGITRDHFVEVELPETAPRTGPLWLVAQGWVHPTDSSINVAISQGRSARPRGLELQAADAAGRFRTVRAGIGFPSGKDKTVLVDLTGVLASAGRRRLRLGTNLEIFWDRIGWAVGRPDVEVTPQRLTLSSAELAERGYSVTEQADAGSPERPRYVLAGTRPRWLDLEGYHTRPGDVRPLLERVDDRYVIMNAGDELRARFPEAPPPAAGLVRDFVLVGDGWVKDGDYNTTFSRTVLPLPTHASGRYETAPRSLEDDPVYRAHPGDWAEYHTRYVSPERARTALRH
ncbi:MAG: FG-GAP-like repeat-containing protein [Vicinamibacteria bacterium]